MSHDILSLDANLRTEFGKGASRRARREGQIPAVLYGHGADPVHLTLPSHATFLALRGNPNTVLNVKYDGKEELALSKDVQVNPVRRAITHVDLLVVKRGEKLTVEVQILISGESAPDTMHTLELQTVSVRADALNLPEEIVANIDGLEDGAIVRASDLELPEGAELETDPEEVVVLISEMYIQEDEEEEDEGPELLEVSEEA